ncbi:TPA: hypothetical protein I7730_00090 [Vibrio vulnificus]|uniref:Uncharacterized protein n=1 Tax=Vibrio vulnificus TaxID=672 RepID=A0A8H9MVA9_VIBVL|nr:hypothetical protein [Vibrio vulnificus]HAS8538197.1 hypothetical protein [Vibrio vulnificus]
MVKGSEVIIRRLTVALGLAVMLSGCSDPPDKNEELTEIFQSKPEVFEESGEWCADQELKEL